MHDDRKAVAGGPVVVVTKLRPPTVRPGTLPREPLQRRLEIVDLPRLTLIAAPAGFGKTTVLATWAHRRASGRPLAWVSLDTKDNDPAVLWAHAIAALGEALPDLQTSADPGTAGSAPLTDSVLPRLVNDLASCSPVDLVFDDVHRVTDDQSRKSLAWAIEHMPDSVHVMMSSRTEPRLPLAAMRVRGDLLELRLADLRFDEAEATELLNGNLGLDLEPRDIRSLVTRTEGWPAGLYLAALSLRSTPDRHAFVSSFGASNRQVLDYLVDEVLRAHEPDVQDLMLRSSILDQLSGPSCDAILRRSGSARDLKELARTNLFLIPLDEHDEYYRFHHLFGQLLQVELQRRYSTEVPELHRRASAWLHGQGSTAAAVDHALEANDFDRAAEIIEGCWPEFSNAGQYATVLSWIRRLPPTFRRGDERLLLVEAWVLSFCGQQSAAAAALDEIGRLSARPGPLPDGFASIDSSVLTLRALLPWGDVGAQLANGLLACEAEPAESRWHACALWSVAAAHYFRGELPEADEWFDEAFTRAVVTGQWIIAASSLAYRSLIAGASADTANQALLASQSTELATGCGLDDVVGEVHSAAGASLAARGDLASALPLLARGVDVMRAWGQPTELIRSLVDLARVLVAAGDSGPAAAALDEARAIADTCTDPADLPRQIADLRRHVTSSGDRPGLTERETEIVELLRDGLSERQIADRLYISFNTVHTHVRSAYRKLGVASRPEALDRAVVLGVLDSDLT